MSCLAQIISLWNRGRFFSIWPLNSLKLASIVRPLGLLQGVTVLNFLFCFASAFLAGILKDIRSERPKIVEKDHLRLLYVAKWFLDYFLRVRTKQSGSKDAEQKTWEFGLIAEVTERAWIGWVLRRMREAVEDKVGLSSYLCI